jgi:Ion channel
MVVTTAIIQLGMQITLDRVTPPRAWTGVSAATQRLAVTIAAVIVLMIGHLCQVSIWAWRYWSWGEVGGFVSSFYFSLASFTTVGASDLVLSSTHRMVGAIESAIGMLMFGWSTALLVALIQRVDQLHKPAQRQE